MTPIKDMDDAILWLARIQHLCAAIDIDDMDGNQIDAVLTAVTLKAEHIMNWLAHLDQPQA